MPGNGVQKEGCLLHKYTLPMSLSSLRPSPVRACPQPAGKQDWRRPGKCPAPVAGTGRTVSASPRRASPGPSKKARQRASVSSKMQLTTSRPPGSRRRQTCSSRLWALSPERPPPMKTRCGSGRRGRHWGTVPRQTSTEAAPKRRRFSWMSRAREGVRPRPPRGLHGPGRPPPAPRNRSGAQIPDRMPGLGAQQGQGGGTHGGLGQQAVLVPQFGGQQAGMRTAHLARGRQQNGQTAPKRAAAASASVR